MMRLALGVLLPLALLCGSTRAQNRDLDVDELRRLRKVETPLDYWAAVQYELDLGKPDVAARYLEGLLKKKPDEKDFFLILDRDGLLRVLQLRDIKVWSSDEKLNQRYRANAEEIARLAGEAHKKRLEDPVRIRKLIGQLRATPEEEAFASKELIRLGAVAVPIIIDVHLRAREADERLALQKLLMRMGSEAIAPMLAALDSNSAFLKLDILEVLHRRHRDHWKEIAPFLWFPSAAPWEDPSVRKAAARFLSDILKIPTDRLPPAPVSLTRAAERYYQHAIDFGKPGPVTIWRWDGKGVVAGWPGTGAVSPAQAEEYFGQRFARQALQLDPHYRPAQVVFLSLGMESGSTPALDELVARSATELLLAVLDRALIEKRTKVVLATTRALSDHRSSLAARPISRFDAPFVRGLYYSDPAVQFAAAEGLLRTGEPLPTRIGTRILTVLTEALERGDPGTSERAMSWLTVLATGKREKLDLRPAGDRIARVVETGKIQAIEQKLGIKSLGQLDGKQVQATLASVAADERRAPEVRIEAARTLVQSVQRQGMLLTPEKVDALRTQASKSGQQGELASQLHQFLGGLRPTDRETGELLRKFHPAPYQTQPKK